VLGLDLAVVGGTLRFFNGESELGGTAALVGRLQSMVDDLGAKAEQADQALAVARAGILAVLEARGVACPEEVREPIAACQDAAILQRWLLRATSARTAAEVIEGS
jgi:hypothetical protein